MNAPEHLPAVDNGVLRFMTCGSVDDGKSTLIGRLLYDTRAILADTLHAIARTSKKRGLDALDLSLLTDGLAAEREQGITIDVAYRFFSTGARKYIVADAPGHEQYTRNMVTAASTADLAVILVDARKGVLAQTRRHSLIAQMVGIPHLVVAVNKMDLVDFSSAAFERIQTDYLAFAAQAGIADVQFVPISALDGDMVVERGQRLDWYRGPTLLEILETTPTAHGEGRDERLRFPVQYVCRPQRAEDPLLHEFRGYMGRIESGMAAIGDPVTVLPGGHRTRIRDMQLGGQPLVAAVADQSVTLLLEDEIDISRGDMIVGDAPPTVTDRVRARVCWFAERPLDARRIYLVRHTTREVRARVMQIDHRLDIATLRQLPSDNMTMNDIGIVELRLAQPIFCDPYVENRATGAFILIDPASNDTVGAGMIL